MGNDGLDGPYSMEDLLHSIAIYPAQVKETGDLELHVTARQPKDISAEPLSGVQVDAITDYLQDIGKEIIFYEGTLQYFNFGNILFEEPESIKHKMIVVDRRLFDGESRFETLQRCARRSGKHILLINPESGVFTQFCPGFAEDPMEQKSMFWCGYSMKELRLDVRNTVEDMFGKTKYQIPYIV